MNVPLLDTRVPAVLLRTDRNPFHHGTLGAVRSLGRAGVEVHLVADCAASPVRSSRFLRTAHAPPRPGARLDEFADVLRRVADRIGRPAVLIALDDASAVAVARLRADLTDRFLLPDLPPDLAEQVADKAELAAMCGRLGLPHPVTAVPDSAAEAEAAARELGLPVVAKWSRPWLLPACSERRYRAAASPAERTTTVLRSPTPGRRRPCTGVRSRRAAGCCSRPSCRRAWTATGSSTATWTVPESCAAAVPAGS